MVVEANKDEGQRCMRIAQEALKNNDFLKAKKFSSKAYRLFPCDESKALFSRVERLASASAGEPSNSEPPNFNSSFTPPGEGGNRYTASSSKSAYDKVKKEDGTAEQRALVSSIRAKKCHYEVLSVSKNANDEDIKKAYRKLALKLHPDKNKAPGADEAFKAVSKAFSVLSNSDERRIYDQYGDTDATSMAGNHFRRRRTATFNGQEVDPEEIFRMFFGGNPFMPTAFSSGSMPRRRQPNVPPNGSADMPIIRLLMSLAPILIIIFANIFSSSKADYSLSKNRDYPFTQATAAHNVPFYVESKTKFSQKYRKGTKERTRIEYQVEADWREMMEKRCYNERLVKHRYEYYGQVEKAARVKLSSCDAIKEKFTMSGNSN